MKKLLSVIFILIICVAVLVGCTSTPAHLLIEDVVPGLSREVGIYDIENVLRAATDSAPKLADKGELTIALEKVKDPAYTLGSDGNQKEYRYIGTYWVITYDMKMDGVSEGHKDDFVRALVIYSVDGATKAAYQAMKATTYIDENGKLNLDNSGNPAATKVEETEVHATYSDNSYTYNAKYRISTRGSDGKIDFSQDYITVGNTFKTGAYKSAAYFNSFMEYNIFRSFNTLNLSGNLAVSYKIPVWSENEAVAVRATKQQEVEVKDVLGLTSDSETGITCYVLAIEKTSAFPGVGTPRNVFYARSDKKIGGDGEDKNNWSYDGNKISVDYVEFEKDANGMKTDKFNLIEKNGTKATLVLVKIFEGNAIYRLKSYMADYKQ